MISLTDAIHSYWFHPWTLYALEGRKLKNSNKRPGLCFYYGVSSYTIFSFQNLFT